MSAVANEQLESISCLFNIEIKSINGQRPTANELISAIETDVKNQLPLSKTAIFKHYTGNKDLSKEDLKKVVHCLQLGIAKNLDTATDAALSYTHAAIICTNELNKV
jgi:hypothetical protein